MSDFAPIRRRLLGKLRARDRKGAAEGICEALTFKNLTPKDYASIAKIAMAIRETDYAEIGATRLRETASDNIEHQIYAANIFAEIGRPASALEILQQLEHAHPNDPMLAHFIGTLLLQYGKFDDAIEKFRAALRWFPNSGKIWVSLSAIKKFSPQDNDFELLRKAIQNSQNRDSSELAGLHYSLGKAYHDTLDFVAAAKAYETGAKAYKSLQPYNSESDIQSVQKILSTHNSKNLEMIRTKNTRTTQKPIFIIGNPRSGTTLIEQIFATQPDVICGGELNLFHMALQPATAVNLTAIIRRHEQSSGLYMQEVADTYTNLAHQRLGKAIHFTDKTLSNSRYVGLILAAIPDAKIIWTQRSAKDTALSCFRAPFSKGVAWSWDFKDIQDHFKLEEQLLTHWTKLLPNSIHVINYEKLVSDPVKQTKSLLLFCGLSPSKASLKPNTSSSKNHSITTASAYQARQPINTKSIEGWKNYPQWFDNWN